MLTERCIILLFLQVSNLVLFKTHKTASTTLALLFHRYGRRHNLEVLVYIACFQLNEAILRMTQRRVLKPLQRFSVSERNTAAAVCLVYALLIALPHTRRLQCTICRDKMSAERTAKSRLSVARNFASHR